MAETVSVIISTKNRPSDLELTVESVLRQSILPAQLIIVDQSDSDESQRRVKKLFAEAPFPAREKIQLCYARDPTISGLTVARNRAMEVAQSEIWLFLDDDVYLERNFVEELVAAYARKPEAVGISGVVTNYPLPPWPYRFWASVFARGPFHDDRQPVYWNADRLRHVPPIRVSRLGGGLMSFRAEKIRGRRFDETLHCVCDGEDVDFCVRLGPGAVLRIAPGARLAHKQSPIGRSHAHWLKRFAQASHYLYDRNWRTGIRNRLCFAWLNVGLGLIALMASARRGSLAPWRDLSEGVREGARGLQF